MGLVVRSPILAIVSIFFAAAVLTVAVAVALTAGITGVGGTTQATGPTPPADCFVADEPTVGGPTVPSDLEASLPPGGPLGQVNLNWSDNSDDETCFVLEARLEADFEAIAFIPANATSYIDGLYEENDVITYRLYAANATDRSEYTDLAGVLIPVFDPTATPRPATPTATPAITPTPAPEETASPMSPAPSPTASPTPAQLPETGGPPRGGSASAAAIGFSLLALAGAFLFTGTMKRRRDDEGREGERRP